MNLVSPPVLVIEYVLPGLLWTRSFPRSPRPPLRRRGCCVRFCNRYWFLDSYLLRPARLAFGRIVRLFFLGPARFALGFGGLRRLLLLRPSRSPLRRLVRWHFHRALRRIRCQGRRSQTRRRARPSYPQLPRPATFRLHLHYRCLCLGFRLYLHFRTPPPFYERQVWIDVESLLAESNVHKCKPISEFQVCVSVNGITAFGMQSCNIGVHLNLVHDVHVCLTCQAAAGHLI